MIREPSARHQSNWRSSVSAGSRVCQRIHLAVGDVLVETRSLEGQFLSIVTESSVDLSSSSVFGVPVLFYFGAFAQG